MSEGTFYAWRAKYSGMTVSEVKRLMALEDQNTKARRKALGTRAPILIKACANARWPLDFVHDKYACGRRFRVLNVVDDVTGECLALAIALGPMAENGSLPDTSISGLRVAKEMTTLVER